MTSDSSEFHDPQFKSAIRRAWSDERCPASVRRQVEAMLADSLQPTAVRTLSLQSIWRAKLSALALAASVAMAAGVTIFSLQRHQSTIAPSRALASAGPAVPVELSQQIVRSHDSCAKVYADDHHLFTSAPPDDFKQIAEAMTREMHYPVIATPLGVDWDFKGAAMCPVGTSNVPHLLFSHQGVFVSVFSLPASVAASSCPDHQTCETNLNGHPVAAFAEAGGFYCVVASSSRAQSVPIQQVRAMRDQLRGRFIAMRDSPRRVASR